MTTSAKLSDPLHLFGALLILLAQKCKFVHFLFTKMQNCNEDTGSPHIWLEYE